MAQQPRPAARARPATDRYRDEAMALSADPDARFRVEIRHADAETFAEARSFNERVRGMAGMAVRDDDGRVLFIHHEDYGGWVFPGGVVEPGESFAAAAAREVREESGVVARPLRPLEVVTFVNRHDGRSTASYFVCFEGEAVDAEAAPPEALGLTEESITDVNWTTTVPAGVADDRTVRRTVALAVDRLPGLSE